MTEGCQEREAHPTADEQGVHFGQQRLDHGQLVGYLRAAEHHGVGPLRRLGEPAQGGQLVHHQGAGIAGQPLGNLDDRGLRAVHHAEPVGDERPVGAHQGGELTGQLAPLGAVFGRLARVEADVLQ